MGLRGPKPTPSAVKIARGTYRADRAAACEAQPLGKPTCPNFLSTDERKEFRRVVRLLSSMGLIGAIDGNALARYARLWCRWRQAEQMITKTGDVFPIKDSDGKVKCLQQSPYVSIARSLSEQLDKLEASFGMNPSARSRIEVAPPQSQADPKARFFDTPMRMVE
ncbi:MAG: phage terminase small subunit P27 family [Bacillota bacterium]